MEHYNVLIVTPGYQMDAAYVKSLVATLTECKARGITYKFLNAQGADINNVREDALSGKKIDMRNKGPLHDKVDYDRIFWIDSDIAWTPKDFFALYDSEHDVITGAYLCYDGTTTTVHGLDTGGPIPINKIRKMTEVTRIQSMGFGFVSMKKGVFERMPRPWFYIADTPSPEAPGVRVSLSEDVSWCVKAMQCQTPIYFDPKVLVTHMKRKKVWWF